MLSWLILGLLGGRDKRSPQSKLSLQLWSGERREAGDSHLQSRLDHSGCRRVRPHPPARSSKSSFQPPDPQREMASSNRGVTQLVWPCRGQALGSTPPGALVATRGSRPVLPVGAPLVPSQDASAVQRAEPVWGCSPTATLRNLCLGVRGSP